jgi:hypothetical protein
MLRMIVFVLFVVVSMAVVMVMVMIMCGCTTLGRFHRFFRIAAEP